MVVPIRKLVNIHFFSSAFSSKPFQIANLPFYIYINIDCNYIRERSVSLSKINSKEALILSNTLFTLYYERMVINNNLLNENVWNPIDSSQLSYNGNIKIGRSVRKMTDNHLPRDSQHIQNKAQALKSTPKLPGESVFNNNTNTCLL